jgi:hypothetical protein
LFVTGLITVDCTASRVALAKSVLIPSIPGVGRRAAVSKYCKIK